MRRTLAAVAMFLLANAGLVGQKDEKLEGYAEWRRGEEIIVDGQRVRADRSTRFEGKGVRDLASIPLGYEVEVSGWRAADGAVVARSLEAKPNGNALFETEVKQATDSMEAQWLQAGRVYEENADGKRVVIGETVESGPEVLRVRRIMESLAPPYVDAAALRVHVVRTKDWNAMAMGNGSIWVFLGLLDEMDDDEVAVVLGHELAHYTHEHTRRSFRRGMWLQLLAVGVAVAAETIDSSKTRQVVQLASVFSLLALQNGYGRDLEDQSDRVGLRYAYEAGYNIRRAPGMWGRFLTKYGDQNRAVNFFFGNHSQTKARIANIDQELPLNYTGP